MRDTNLLLGIDWGEHHFGGTISDPLHETTLSVIVTCLNTPSNLAHIEAMVGDVEDATVILGKKRFAATFERGAVTTVSDWISEVEIKFVRLIRIEDHEHW
jgi:RNase H-fold protein (predicted Holliday junction resolvase)